jgi:hypothetical protein
MKRVIAIHKRGASILRNYLYRFNYIYDKLIEIDCGDLANGIQPRNMKNGRTGVRDLWRRWGNPALE